MIAESLADGGLHESSLVPEYTEDPDVPPPPTCAYPIEEFSDEKASSNDAEYIWSIETRPAGEGESLEGRAEAAPLNISEKTPRSVRQKGSEDDEDDIVPQAQKVQERRLKRKRELSPSGSKEDPYTIE